MNTVTSTTKTTRDLYLAAALLSLGAVYEGANRDDPRNMEFKFSPKMAKMTSDSLEIPTMDLDNIEKSWVNHTLVVNATDYADAIKRMKSLVHTSP